MAIIWVPIAPIPSLSGSASCVGGVVTEWLSCLKGEQISGHISSTHSSQNYCVSVAHIITPYLPVGISIFDNIGTGGIDISGLTTDVLYSLSPIEINSIGNNQHTIPTQIIPKPIGDILTHYTSSPIISASFIITTLVTWNHDANVSTPYSQDWIMTIYNSWEGERQIVLAIK